MGPVEIEFWRSREADVTDPIGFWREMERRLEGMPQSDETRRRLLDVVRCINTAVTHDALKPEQAAARVMELVGLTGAVIKTYRDAHRAERFGGLFEWDKLEIERGERQGKVDALAEDWAKAAGVKTRTIYRWGQQASARIKAILASRY